MNGDIIAPKIGVLQMGSYKQNGVFLNMGCDDFDCI
jgi:hypothetical protein